MQGATECRPRFKLYAISRWRRRYLFQVRIQKSDPETNTCPDFALADFIFRGLAWVPRLAGSQLTRDMPSGRGLTPRFHLATTASFVAGPTPANGTASASGCLSLKPDCPM